MMAVLISPSNSVVISIVQLMITSEFSYPYPALTETNSRTHRCVSHLFPSKFIQFLAHGFASCTGEQVCYCGSSKSCSRSEQNWNHSMACGG